MNTQDSYSDGASMGSNGGYPSGVGFEDRTRLEREIQGQRSHISELVQALESKFSPGEMFERVLRSGKGGSGEFARNLSETVKANPLPALVTAAGLLWLYSCNKSSHGVDHGQPGVDSSGPGVGEKISGKLGDVKQRASGAAQGAKQAISSKAHQASDGVRHMLDTNPMTVGAMSIAVGALVGAFQNSAQTMGQNLGGNMDQSAGLNIGQNMGQDPSQKIGSSSAPISGPWN